MKHTAAMSTDDVLHKIEALEKDILALKLTVIKRFAPSSPKTISLKGILKDVTVTERDIAGAKKSLYSTIGL